MVVRLTKIIATLGPVSGNKTMIQNLMAKGGFYYGQRDRKSFFGACLVCTL
jgi:hypothetical protein